MYPNNLDQLDLKYWWKYQKYNLNIYTNSIQLKIWTNKKFLIKNTEWGSSVS